MIWAIKLFLKKMVPPHPSSPWLLWVGPPPAAIPTAVVSGLVLPLQLSSLWVWWVCPAPLPLSPQLWWVGLSYPCSHPHNCSGWVSPAPIAVVPTVGGSPITAIVPMVVVGRSVLPLHCPHSCSGSAGPAVAVVEFWDQSLIGLTPYHSEFPRLQIL